MTPPTTPLPERAPWALVIGGEPLAPMYGTLGRLTSCFLHLHCRHQTSLIGKATP